MPDSRKIVIIGSAYPLRGGLAAFNERLANEYMRQGDEVTLYSFSLQYPSFLFPGKSQYSAEPPPKGLSIKTRINSINPLNWIRIGTEIRNMKPDLVIVKYWMPFMAPCLGTICRMIRRNHHTRIISIIDNIIPHERRAGDRMLSSYFTGSVDGFVTMSKSVLLELEPFVRQKPKVYSPHPLYDHFGKSIPKHVAKSNLGLNPDKKFILFFGFIREYKGLDLLLRAIALPGFMELNVNLLVAGEFYCDREPYQKIIDGNNLNDLVVMSNDFIPDSRVKDYFCAADLVVQPYKNATQSGVTQIAYHFDKPMIITDVGGLAEFVPDGVAGFVVHADPESVADAILRFYHENKETAFSTAVSVEKKKYGWGKMLEAIATLEKTVP